MHLGTVDHDVGHQLGVLRGRGRVERSATQGIHAHFVHSVDVGHGFDPQAASVGGLAGSHQFRALPHTHAGTPAIIALAQPRGGPQHGRGPQTSSKRLERVGVVGVLALVRQVAGGYQDVAGRGFDVASHLNLSRAAQIHDHDGATACQGTHCGVERSGVELLIALGRNVQRIHHDRGAITQQGVGTAVDAHTRVGAGNACKQAATGRRGLLEDLIDPFGTNAQGGRRHPRVRQQARLHHAAVRRADGGHAHGSPGADAERIGPCVRILAGSRTDGHTALARFDGQTRFGCIGTHSGRDAVDRDRARGGRSHQTKTRRRRLHLGAQPRLCQRTDLDAVLRANLGQAAGTASHGQVTRAVDGRGDRGADIVDRHSAAPGKREPHTPRNRHRHRGGARLDGRFVGGADVHSPLAALHLRTIDGGRDLTMDDVVGSRDAQGEGVRRGAKGGRHRDRLHTGANAGHVVGGERDVAIHTDTRAGGAAQSGQHVGVHQVDRTRPRTADRNTRQAAHRGRCRPRQHPGTNALLVLCTYAQVQGPAGVGAGVDGRVFHHGLDDVGRRAHHLLPLVGVGKILGQEQVIGLAVFVQVALCDRILADVFVGFIRPSPGVLGQAHNIACDQPCRVVLALPVGDGGALGHRVGVVADVVARDGDADRSTNACCAPAAHADRGSNDGGVDAAVGQRFDHHIVIGGHSGIAQCSPRVRQDDVHRHGARSTHPDAGATAKPGCHRSRQRKHLDIRIGAGPDRQGAGLQDSRALQFSRHLAIHDVASQGYAHRHGRPRSATHCGGQRRRTRQSGDPRMVGSQHRDVLGREHAGANPQGLQGGAASTHPNPDLVLRPHARTTGGEATAAPPCHRSRSREHHRVDGLTGIRRQLNRPQGGDGTVFNQGPHRGDRALAHHAKTFLTDQVARHRNPDGSSDTATGADTDRRRQGGNGGRDAGIGQREHPHRLVGGGGAVDQQGVGRTTDGVDGDSTSATECQTRGADRHRRGRCHRHCIDVVACQRDLTLLEGHEIALAIGIHQFPRGSPADHGQGQLRLHRSPSAGVSKVGGGQVERLVVLSDIAVHGVGNATLGVELAHLDRVSLAQHSLRFREGLPQGGVAEVGLGHIQAQARRSGCPQIAIHRIAVLDGHIPDRVALSQGHDTLPAVIHPGLTMTGRVQRCRPDRVDLSQRVPGVQERLSQQRQGGRVGKVGGPLPARGVSQIFLGQHHVLLEVPLFPQLGVGEIRFAEIDPHRDGLQAQQTTRRPFGVNVFEDAPTQGRVGMVVGNTHQLAQPQLADTLVGGVLHRTAHEAIHRTGHAPGQVVGVHADGVAHLDLGAGCRFLAPVTAAEVGAAQVHQGLVCAAVFVNTIGLRLENQVPLLQHGGSVLRQVIPRAPVVGVCTGSGVGVGGSIQRSGGDALRSQFLCVQIGTRLNAARIGPHLQRASACIQVGLVGARQHVGIDAVESERQTDGHTQIGSAAQRGSQRSRTRHRIDTGTAVRADHNTVGLQIRLARRGAIDPGVDAGENPVLGVTARCTDRFRARTTRANGGGTGHHVGLDLGLGRRVHGQLPHCLDIGLIEMRPCGRRLRRITHQLPTAFIGIVLGGEVDGGGGGRVVAHILVDFTAQQAAVIQDAIALAQSGQLVA